MKKVLPVPGIEAGPAAVGVRVPKQHRGFLAADISPAGRLGTINETTPGTARLIGYSSIRDVSWPRGIINNVSRASSALTIAQGAWDLTIIVYSIFD